MALGILLPGPTLMRQPGSRAATRLPARAPPTRVLILPHHQANLNDTPFVTTSPRAPMQRHARHRKALPLQARWRNKCAELLACLGIDVVSHPVVPTAILQLREDRGDHEGISCYLSTERHNCDPAQARVPGSVPLFFYLEASSARYILRSTVKELRELLPV